MSDNNNISAKRDYLQAIKTFIDETNNNKCPTSALKAAELLDEYTENSLEDLDDLSVLQIEFIKARVLIAYDALKSLKTADTDLNKKAEMTWADKFLGEASERWENHINALD